MRRAAIAALFAVVVALLGYGWSAREERSHSFMELRAKHAVLHVPQGTKASAWAAEADRRLEAMASRLGLELPKEPLHLFFHDSTVTKEALAGDDAPFTVKADRREVHHLVSPGGGITDPRGDALLLLRLAWGPPGSERLAHALARWAAGDFHGTSLLTYASRIAHEEGPYPLREVLSDDREGPQLSPLVADVLGGAWVERMRQTRGPGVLKEIWSAPAWDDNPGWETWLRHLPSAPSPQRRRSSLPFQRGVTLAHEGFRTNEGYGSDAALKQLVRLQELGANSVTLVPYGFTRAPEETGVRWTGTDESDDRVARTIREARRLGLTTVLKPQLWARGRWTGDIFFPDDAAFRRWMAAYRRFVLHYARLAELEQADLLVIGTELGGLTVRSDRGGDWRALIREVRRVYSGPLTYAANWGQEFETLAFWDDLDLLGVNLYYPLAAQGELPRAGSPRLQELERILEGMSRKHRRPVLFTEVGYPASASAAVEPWKERTGPLDPEMQARCYEVIFQSFYRERWLAGLHWWKWPSPGRGSAEDPSFSPLGKPALDVLERWYGKAALAR